MTIDEIIQATASASNCTTAVTRNTIDLIGQWIIDELKAGRTVTIPGLITLRTKMRSSRTIKNPWTHITTTYPPVRVMGTTQSLKAQEYLLGGAPPWNP